MVKSKNAYNDKQKKDLLSIPYVSGSGPHNKKIAALAKKWKRSYGVVWQKWYSLHTKERAITTTDSKGVQPLNFEIIDFVPGKISIHEDTRMREEMRKILNGKEFKGDNTPERGIVVESKWERRIRKFLDEEFGNHKFMFHKHPRTKTHKILVKKS